MGTKRELAGDVAEAVASCRAGPMLDAFSGMCSVGEAVGTDRQVWINDAQVFAYEVGRSLFASTVHPLSGLSVADMYYDRFKAKIDAASERLLPALALEEEVLEAKTFEAFERAWQRLNRELEVLIPTLACKDNNLFTSLYSNSFFGLRQALEVDAIVHAIRWLGSKTNVSDQNRWLMIGLGRSLLRVSNSTGHFAQYLKPKVNNFKKFQSQRKRSVWDEWLISQDEMIPVGDPAWRSQNLAFNTDALLLFEEFQRTSTAPGVVYADPPYTNDQYSRYYHIFETLALYDYPEANGAGKYRQGRFVTPFSLKSKAAVSIQTLAKSVRGIDADLVLSYPTNGLAYKAGFSPEGALRSFYRSVDVHRAIAHDHSTFGASKGNAKSQVIEMIYVARV